MRLYDFLVSKINVGGYVMPPYVVDKILLVDQKLTKKKLDLSFETYDLLLYCFDDTSTFLNVVDLLYSYDDLSERNKQMKYYEKPYYQTFYALHHYYTEHILIDPDLKEVLRVFKRNEISYFETDEFKKVLRVVSRYYWINRDKYTIESFDKLISKIKYENYNDIFVLNGIIDKSGNPIVSEEKYHKFIDLLLELEEKGKIIIK
ncbi:MAG: hypothetical protein J6X02_00180 [Bacilli bacterium]|nr:hypothetical protein [Bacilli bacterium]